MEDTTAAFGEVLRRFRVAAALSQEELAERSGVSARGISDLERGIRQGPRPETLRRLADALAREGPDRALLYAAAHPERRETPSREPTRGATTLPLPGRPLFGRDEDRAALAALLCRSDVKLVTITGAGGTGKTHLALDVASRLSAAFPDGVVFVNLVPLVDPTQVMPAVAMALGIGEAPEQSLRDGLIAALREKQMLLLLDNCEQVLEAAPEIGAVLAACPALTVLATSREALHLRDERAWPLSPLPLPDLDRLPALDALERSPAVALFTARAEASDPRFSLTAQNARAVATICHRVDGIPLAIELAAARVKLLAPVELASRLQQRLPLLTGGPRDAPARQRTLRDAIAWSYDLLAPREQAVFRSLSVFVGGWTVEAAEAVVNPAAGLNVLDILGSLLDKSLVRVDERGDASRFGMLETVREFALEQLAREGEVEAMRERHAAYVWQLVERGEVAFEGVEQKQWLAMLEREHPNIREAFAAMETRGDDEGYLRLAGALHLFWCFRTHATEGLQRLQRALANETRDPGARARALVGAGSLAWAVGDYPNAELWLMQAESLARDLAAPPLLAQAMFLRGAVAEDAGDEVATEACYLAALAEAQAIDHTWLVSALLTNLGDAAYRRGEIDLAERFALDAIAPLRESRNAYMACMNLANLAQVALTRGDVGHAAAALRDSLRIAEEIDSEWNVANVVGCVAALAAARGRDDQAATFLGVADAACAVSGHRRLPSHFLFAQTLETVRCRLGPDRFQCAWDAGRARSVENVIDDVRAVIAETGGDAISHHDRPDG